MNSIEGKWNSIREQKNLLLELNPDRVFWVYTTKINSWSNIELELSENILVCFENQLQNLKGLSDCEDITLLNLKDFSQGQVSVLAWNTPAEAIDIDSLSMASGWVIEFFQSETQWEIDGEQIKNLHMITTLRDGGSTSENQRTTTAGRITGENIAEEIEREHVEEAPFLWKLNGQYCICISSSTPENRETLYASIENFLEHKYFPKDKEKAKLFEASFSGIKYRDLWAILKNIVKYERIHEYSYNNLEDVKGLESMKKNVTIWNHAGTYYGFYNPNQKTWEFKSVRKFKSFPKWFSWLWKIWRPTRLFLESSNQSPRYTRIENAATINPANAIKIIAEEIQAHSKEVIDSVYES